MPPEACGMVFDNDRCTGWQLKINVGFTKLGPRHNNDAEALIARNGCILVGKIPSKFVGAYTKADNRPDNGSNKRFWSILEDLCHKTKQGWTRIP